MIFLRNVSMDTLYIMNREQLEKFAANYGEYVYERVKNVPGVYLTNEFKIIFDDNVTSDEQIMDTDEYKKSKIKSDREIKELIEKLNTRWSKQIFVRNILYNNKDIIIRFKEHQKEILIEILNNKSQLKPFLKTMKLSEIVEFDKRFAAASAIFPINKHRRQLKSHGLLRKIGTRYFVSRNKIQNAIRLLKKINNKNEVIYKEDVRICDKLSL
jgi:hypothetical protein